MNRSLSPLSVVTLFLLLAGCATPTPTPAAATATAPAASTPTPAAVAPTALPTVSPTTASMPAITPTPLSFTDLTPLATEFVSQLAAEDFTAAASRFDATMKSAAPPDKLKQIWEQVTGQVGPYQKQIGTHTAEAQGFKIVWVTTQFEKSPLDVRVVFDARGEIAGLFFDPPQSSLATPQAYEPPAYAKPEAFTESDVTVGSGEWALPGTLTLPKGEGPFPAVVLVHGSGPNDRDETVGPNKPFRDIAWGLASQGIAVLRYDKRTNAHKDLFTPAILASLTVKEEVTDDVLLAVALLRQTAQVDPNRVFVLGHSLGATVLPRIGQADSSLAGLIFLAGLTRPLEDAVLDQVTYLSNLDGTLTDQDKADIARLDEQVKRVKDPALSKDTPSADLPLGINAAYWLDLRGYQPAQVAKTLSMPLLVLQGERDYQVSPTADFPGWETALADKPNATLKLYPKLNHLFIAGEGAPNPDEYNTPGHVDAGVVSDIGAWVLQQK